MTTERYLGTTATFSFVYASSATPNVPGDTTNVARIRRPDRTIEDVATTRDSAGHYHVDVLLDQEGTWIIQGIGSSPIAATTEATVVSVTRQSVDIAPNVPYVTSICSPWVDPAFVYNSCRESCGGKVPTSDLIDLAAEGATDFLFNATARQFSGNCRAVIRPCAGYCQTTSCGCQYLDEVNLTDYGYWPIRWINSVKVDGVTLDPARYRVDDWKFLVRLPVTTEHAYWPRCQNLLKASTEVGTWEIDLQYGQDPPALLKNAAALLAGEMLKSFIGAPCNLPNRATSVSRQGVTMNLVDTRALAEGKTGLYLVDLAIAAFNPKKLQSSSLFWSPETHTRRARRVGTS